MTSRRPSTTAVLTTLVLAVLLAVLAFDWVSARQGWRLPWAVADLLPADRRDQPRPGYEEADERLLPAVTVASPDPGHVFQHTTGDGTPVGWSPCRPVHVVVDPAGGPAGFDDEVRVVLDELSTATGLVLVHDGVVSEPAAGDRAAFQPEVYGDRWAPVLVAWADESTVPGLAGDVLGLASVQMMSSPLTGDRAFVTGTVHLDTQVLDAAAGYDPAAYPAVLRHELAHVIGLDHVDDPDQLMNAVTGVATFQTGDLTGLAALGRGACTPGL